MIVSFSGIDCAGKSTQIALLRDRLSARGSRVSLIWYRPGYSPWLNAIRRAIRRVRPGALPSATDVAQREAAFSKPGVSKVWLAAAILDTYLVYVIGVRVLSAMGRVVICDRFVEDAILDLQLRFPEVKIAELKSIRSLRALAPKARLSVLLVIDWTEMLRRMEEKQEPFPDTPSIRERRFAAYLDLRDQGIYTVIDASRSPEEIFDEIAAHLDSRR